MENYETLRMPELCSLARANRLRNYSRLRKDDLIALLWNNTQVQSEGEAQRLMLSGDLRVPPPRELECKQEQLESEVPLTKRQLKNRRNKHFKLAKKFKSLEAEYNNLKSQMDATGR